MDGDDSKLVRARIREQLPDALPERVRRVEAAAAYAAATLLVDRHLSHHEELKLRQCLTGDFSPGDAELVVRLLVELPETLIRLPASLWLDELGDWLFGVAVRHSTNAPEDHSLISASLSLRWRLPMSTAGRWRIDQGDMSWDDSLLQLGHPSAIRSLAIAWWDVRSVEPVDPWPELLVEWQPARGMLEAVRLAPKGDPKVFADAVREIMETARRRVSAADQRVRAGWLDAPEVEWEAVDRWPTDPAPTRSGYRQAPTKPETIVATRERGGGIDTMLRWLASSPSRPFQRQISEACLTEGSLYVRRRKGEIERIRRNSLRTRRGSADAVYVFGRSAEALLTGRFDCAICRHLDEQLMARRRRR